MLVYTGYEKVEYDRKDGTHICGYNLFLLEETDQEGSYGYRPYMFFDGRTNQRRFPWISPAKFESLGVSRIAPMSFVEVGLNFSSMKVMKAVKPSV